MPARSTRQPLSARAGAATLLLLIALALDSCGTGSSQRPAGASTGGLQGAGVPDSAVAVIKGWADALRAGQLARASAYFAHPSAMINGVDAAGHLTVIRILTAHDALIADESLPCGATLRSTGRNGPYIEADFELTSRTGAGANSSGCAGPARVDFLIGGGHIVRWLRAPTAAPPAAPTPAPAPAGAGAQPI
jgi:hypothetical protein